MQCCSCFWRYNLMLCCASLWLWLLVHFKRSFAEQATNRSQLVQTLVALGQNWLMSEAVLTNSTVGKSKPIKGATRRPLSNLTSLHPGATVFTQHLRRIYSSLQPYLHVQYLQIETLCQIWHHILVHWNLYSTFKTRYLHRCHLYLYLCNCIYNFDFCTIPI